MKVVLDTNIFVSAFIVKNGNPAQILRFIDKIELITSREILEETEEVLNRKHIKKKYRLTDKQIKEYIVALQQSCILTKPTYIERVIKDDPDDDIVLAMAKQTKANYIVSGDPHLTKLKAYEHISILTPVQFLKILVKIK